MSNLSTYQPGQAEIVNLINRHPGLADSTKMQYRKAILNYLETGQSLADVEALSAYAATLNKSSRSFLKASVKLWSKHMATQIKGGLAYAEPGDIKATTEATQKLYILDSVNEAIQVEATKGSKAHAWLSQAEVKKLLATCNTNTLQGKRDRIVIGLLVGAGLRREELANLTFDDIVLQPVKGKFRTVLNVKGKGAKDRGVPIRDSLAEALTDWQAIVGSGFVARSVLKGDRIGDSLSAIGIFHIVRSAGSAIGKAELAPHDLRRSYAQIGLDSGVSIVQISKLLGHASVATTQKYLNLDLDLSTTISDFVPFE